MSRGVYLVDECTGKGRYNEEIQCNVRGGGCTFINLILRKAAYI
jgi:hypothetical protein